MNDLLLQVLADDQKIITYRKEFNQHTGSVTATILLQQLIYHSAKNKYAPFYKFIEPCKSELYRVGDSWTEELGFTKNEFNTAYKKLEKLGLVTKTINMNRVTYYQINKSILGKAIKSIYEKEVMIKQTTSNDTKDNVLPVKNDYAFSKNDKVTLEYSKNKEQRILEEEEEEEKHEILNLEYLDDFIDVYTNNKKTIKCSYASYKNSVLNSLKCTNHKNHKKTKLNYENFMKNMEAKILKKEIKPTPLVQLGDITEINPNDYVGKMFHGKIDDGIIQVIAQEGLNTYNITFKGLGVRQSQKLLHVQVVTSAELLQNIKINSIK